MPPDRVHAPVVLAASIAQLVPGVGQDRVTDLDTVGGAAPVFVRMIV
jgi:hypothetical protein